MKQLNSYRFYELGAKLHSLFEAENETRVSDLFVPLSEIQALLDGFIKGNVFPLTTSKADAAKLLDKIGGIFNRYFIDPSTKQLRFQETEDRIDRHEFALIHTLVEKFEHALAAELNFLPVYAAERRGIYSIHDLAENAREIFPEALRGVIPARTQDEFCAAGRALAFGFGTAAVLHILRAVDIALRAYYEVFDKETQTKSDRNFSAAIKKLAAFSEEEDRQPRPDKRIIQTLTHIKEQYRNPLIVSDNDPSVDDALQFFNTASTLISAMGNALLDSRRRAVEKTGAELADDNGANPKSSTKKAG